MLYNNLRIAVYHIYHTCRLPLGTYCLCGPSPGDNFNGRLVRTGIMSFLYLYPPAKWHHPNFIG